MRKECDGTNKSSATNPLRVSPSSMRSTSHEKYIIDSFTELPSPSSGGTVKKPANIRTCGDPMRFRTVVFQHVNAVENLEIRDWRLPAANFTQQLFTFGHSKCLQKYRCFPYLHTI